MAPFQLELNPAIDNLWNFQIVTSTTPWKISTTDLTILSGFPIHKQVGLLPSIPRGMGKRERKLLVGELEFVSPEVRSKELGMSIIFKF